MDFAYSKDLTNPVDYPTVPAGEPAARQQFMDLFNEIKDAHNAHAAEILHMRRYPLILPEIDDTARMQRALVASQNKILMLEEDENYNISQTLLLPTGCRIFGQYATITNNITTQDMVFHIKYSNCAICGINIVNTVNNIGITLAESSYNGSAIVVGYDTNVDTIYNTVIDGVTVTNGIENVSGIILMGKVENAEVRNCVVDGDFLTSFHVEWNGVSVISPKNVTFTKCIAQNNTHTDSYAYYISGAVGVNLKQCIAKNVVSGVMLYCGDNGAETGTEIVYTLDNSSILNFTGYGVSIKGTNIAQTIARYTGVKIDNCNIKGLSNGAAAVTEGIRIFINDGGISITNNKIETVNKGIRCDPSSGIDISHNEFDDIYEQAIKATSFKRGWIKDNIFKDVSIVGNTTADHVNIYLTYNSDDNEICGNKFGYAGQTIRPFAHIYLFRDANANNLSQNNNIHDNSFYKAEIGFSIINGTSADNLVLKTYIHSNKPISGDAISTGAYVYTTQGTSLVIYGGAMPTSGTWTAKDYVVNMFSTIAGTAGSKYTLDGWKRITTGSNNVLNVDWVEDRALTGA
jgi:hypothetical protein